MRHADRQRRRPSAHRQAPSTHPSGPWDDDTDQVPREPTALHTLRLQAVHDALHACGARRVADLGCGDGALVRRLLADASIEHIVAIDSSLAALGRLQRSLAGTELARGRLTLLQASFAQAHAELRQVDAAVLVETIEHVPPARLSGVEQHVFGTPGPATVVVTTPNQEYNELFGMAPGQMREPGHHFEWSRQRFRTWAQGVALRRGYTLAIMAIGAVDAQRGSPTQMALFTRTVAARS